MVLNRIGCGQETLEAIRVGDVGDVGNASRETNIGNGIFRQGEHNAGRNGTDGIV
jgi:hypothetical protein